MSKVARSATLVSPLDLATAARESVADVLQDLGATEEGLASGEAAARRSSFGANVLATHE